ncbi:BspA family leucine-rich repeat surface protein [Helicobacter typhlonius]|uniref:BspA family leucine-rich repeat surface protein n=1 Tax=Helicobacter typhlonius TaxID=76936 RepID=UPI002FDF79AD
MKNLNKELLEVLYMCLEAPIEELESLKAKVLALIEQGAVIDKETISGLETYVSDLEQEYWDDRAVYAGCSAKATEEYRLLKVLQKFHKAKDKAKAFDRLFVPVTKSKGITYQAELKKLIKNRYIYLGDIDVSSIKNFDKLFEDSYRKDFSGIESWNVSHVADMYAMFEGAKYFNADIGGWNVSKVIDMTYMFNRAEKFNQNLHWQLNNACLVEGMFDGTPLEKNPPKWYKDRTEGNELADIQSVCIFFKEAKRKGGIVKKSDFADVYKRAFEAVKNIHSHKKISDQELYRIFALCVSDERLCYNIAERTSSHATRAEFVPLEFIEFLIENAKDKSVVLGKHQKKKDFVWIAINSRRKDIAELLVKNGLEAKE